MVFCLVLFVKYDLFNILCPDYGASIAATNLDEQEKALEERE